MGWKKVMNFWKTKCNRTKNRLTKEDFTSTWGDFGKIRAPNENQISRFWSSNMQFGIRQVFIYEQCSWGVFYVQYKVQVPSVSMPSWLRHYVDIYTSVWHSNPTVNVLLLRLFPSHGRSLLPTPWQIHSSPSSKYHQATVQIHGRKKKKEKKRHFHQHVSGNKVHDRTALVSKYRLAEHPLCILSIAN